MERAGLLFYVVAVSIIHLDFLLCILVIYSIFLLSLYLRCYYEIFSLGLGFILGTGQFYFMYKSERVITRLSFLFN